MRLGAYDTIVDNCKRLSQLHQFRPEPILLMLSAMGGGYKQQSSWQNLALQKFLHRELRIYDEAVCGVKLRYNSRVQRWAQIQTTGQSRRLGDFIDIDDEVDETAGKSSQQWRPGTQDVDEDDEPEEEEGDGEGEEVDDADASAHPSGAVEEATEIPKPTKHSPVFNALYGQNMLTAKSYQSALCEWFSPPACHVSQLTRPPQSISSGHTKSTNTTPCCACSLLKPSLGVPLCANLTTETTRSRR